MLVIGAVLAVIAVVLIVLGATQAAVGWLLYAGLALIVVAVLLTLFNRTRR